MDRGASAYLPCGTKSASEPGSRMSSGEGKAESMTRCQRRAIGAGFTEKVTGSSEALNMM